MLRDLRYALRTLRGSPAFAVTVILTLGIGLGLNTTLFTLFNTYVLHPFAVNDPYSLYGLRWHTTKSIRPMVTWDQYQDLKRQKTVFTDTIGFSPFLAKLESRNLVCIAVTGNYFTALGVGASIGRPILPEDASVPGTGALVVLSDQLWKSDFGADPAIVGRTVRISGRPFEVIGIADKAFVGLAEFPVDFYVPLTVQSAIVPVPDLFGPDKPSGILAVGRLNPAITLDQAQAALTGWLRNLTDQLPEGERAIDVTLHSRATPVSLDPEILTLFLPLLVVFGLVLLICCANVSNMMLARALGRQREIGVRLAIGASRVRLIRQLLAENLLLSLLAAAVGFAVSIGTVRGAQRLLVATLPPSLNLVHVPPLDPDYRMFFFLVSAAAFATVVCGLAPALQATRASLTEALRGEFGVAVSASGLRSVLVVSQISVCLILLVLTGILLRGSSTYQRMDPGYKPHGVVYPLFLGRTDPGASWKVAQELVTAQWINVMAAAGRPPLRPVVQVPMSPAGQGTQTIRAAYNFVSPEYFGVLDIPILRGRNFSGVEGDAEAPVAIVSQATAQKFWPNEDALGKSIVLDKKTFPVNDAPRTAAQAVVVGIVKDIASGSMIAGIDSTMVYFPTSLRAKRALTFLIRGKGSLAATSRELEKALAATVPDRPVIATSLDDMLVAQLYPFRASAWCAAMLGVIALLLTVSGLYGVLSYLVGQRTKEIGIRMAMGATPGIVVRLVLAQSLKFAMWGVALGLALAFGGSLVLRHLLTMINAYDAVSYGIGVGVVGLAAMAAALLPSNRAARISPVQALRAE